MTSIKIATLTGDTAFQIKKAIDDTGILRYEDNSTTSKNILDVYIEIEDWRKELIENWSPKVNPYQHLQLIRRNLVEIIENSVGY
ncbi:hypothetical protein BH18THE1_BH18THE1_18230 [soil metagenome]